MNIAVIGGGPAGLRAAEIAALGGAKVTLFEAKPSVGRKFLIAGKGGLNLTKDEPRDVMSTQYSAGPWNELLAAFDAAALRAWAAKLGVETFVASTRRVYPRELKAAPLLRRWVQQLRTLGVEFAVNHRWCGLRRGKAWQLDFTLPEGGTHSVQADAVILALGGASWPETGSNGRWTSILQEHDIAIAPLQPANCGWEVAWPREVLAVAEGQPLKSIKVRAGSTEVAGELLITAYGLEGGALYQLGPILRALPNPEVALDFKPTFSIEQLVTKLGPVRRNFLAEARQRWRLSDAMGVLLEHGGGSWTSGEALAQAVKNFRLPLLGPRPIAEAISSAGGVAWAELDEGLMLRQLPGIYVAGEMIDWEAPTGGYLIQGCFASGTRAAEAALQRLNPAKTQAAGFSGVAPADQ